MHLDMNLGILLHTEIFILNFFPEFFVASFFY